MERLDYFLIWEHGLDHKYEILSEIRAEFQILFIIHRNVGAIAGFVRRLYSCDTVPMRHLVSKTAYLNKIGSNVLFILVNNENPDEQLVGQGAFKHIQCVKINRVKRKIRDRFNPPNTEHHVIHTSDYESQVKHTMKVLRIRLRKDRRTGAIRTERLDNLLANIYPDGLKKIEDTPHYEYVSGNKDAYRRYYEKHMGTRFINDHTPEAFDILIKNFKYKDPIKVSGNKILDGVHRAAILKKGGVDEIRVEDVSIQPPASVTT